MVAEYEDVMKRLIKTAVRTFYEPCHVVVCDILLENILLSDFEFSARMKIMNKEFNKFILKLKEDRIIKCEIKMETKEDNRQLLRTMCFFDYAEVKDIIKYKIFHMARALEVKATSEDEAFYCPSCEKTFSALDAQACIVNFVFKCVFCKNNLIEKVNDAENGKLDLKELLNNLNQIVALLKESDKYTIPTVDYFQVLESKKVKENAKESDLKVVKKEEPVKLIIETHEEDVNDNFEQNTVTVTQKRQKTADDVFNPSVTVQGKEKKYLDVTEADIENMTEEEYSNYYEIHMQKEGMQG